MIFTLLILAIIGSTILPVLSPVTLAVTIMALSIISIGVLAEVVNILISFVGGLMYAGLFFYDALTTKNNETLELDLYKSKELLTDACLSTIIDVSVLVLLPIALVIDFFQYITIAISTLLKCAGFDIFDEKSHPVQLPMR